MRGKAAIANARLAYQRFEQVFDSARWERLEALDARPQRPLWASTGVKDPAYDDTRYVVELVAPGTVNTMPEGDSAVRSPTTAWSAARGFAAVTARRSR